MTIEDRIAEVKAIEANEWKRVRDSLYLIALEADCFLEAIVDELYGRPGLAPLTR